MKKKKILFLVVCVLVMGTYLGYRYLYKDHRDIQSEKPSLNIKASELLGMFQSDATPETLNKTIVVSGVVSEKDTESITLEGIVHCVLLSSDTSINVGEMVSVKGRCIGYDELFELVKLDQSQLIEKP